MDDMKQYTVEVCEMKECEIGAVKAESGPICLEAAFYRRRRAVLKLAEAGKLETHAAHIVDVKGLRF